MDPQEARKGPVRVIGFDKSYGIVYVELADGSFMSADFIDSIIRTGSIRIKDAPTQPVSPEYVVKEMISSEHWVDIDEMCENWIEAIKLLQENWQYSASMTYRGRKHAEETGEPFQLNVSSGPIPGLLEESTTGEVIRIQDSMFLKSTQMVSHRDITKSILIIEEEVHRSTP